jgi:hypothetical protein
VLETLEDGHAAMRFQHETLSAQSMTIASGGAFVRDVDPLAGLDSPDWLVLAIAKHANERDGILFAGLELVRPGIGPCLFTGKTASASSGFGLELGERFWNDGALHAYAFALDGRNGTGTLYADGDEVTTTYPYPGTRRPRRFIVGGDPVEHGCIAAAEGCYRWGSFVTSPLDGAIAEVMVFRGASGSEKDVEFLRAYVKQKYGLRL